MSTRDRCVRSSAVLPVSTKASACVSPASRAVAHARPEMSCMPVLTINVKTLVAIGAAQVALAVRQVRLDKRLRTQRACKASLTARRRSSNRTLCSCLRSMFMRLPMWRVLGSMARCL
jgi:hypothetical protein